MEEITSLKKKLGECEKTTNLGRIKNVRGWLDKMSRNRNGGRGDCVQTKGKKRKGGVNQYAAAIRAGKAKKLCGIYLRDDDSGWAQWSPARFALSSTAKKGKLFTTFYNSL